MGPFEPERSASSIAQCKAKLDCVERVDVGCLAQPFQSSQCLFGIFLATLLCGRVAAHPKYHWVLEDPVVLGMRGYASAEEGRKEDAKEALRGLERLRKTAYVDPFYAVQLCFALGDRACASLWLKRAHEDRSAIFVYVPLYYKDGLRLVPEAQALLADIR